MTTARNHHPRNNLHSLVEEHHEQQELSGHDGELWAGQRGRPMSASERRHGWVPAGMGGCLRGDNPPWGRPSPGSESAHGPMDGSESAHARLPNSISSRVQVRRPSPSQRRTPPAPFASHRAKRRPLPTVALKSKILLRTQRIGISKPSLQSNQAPNRPLTQPRRMRGRP